MGGPCGRGASHASYAQQKKRERERERERGRSHFGVHPPLPFGGRSRAALRACCWEQLKPPAHSGPRRSLASRVCAIKRSIATGSITSPRRFCRGSTSNGDYHSVVIESYLGNTASKDFLVEMSKAGEDPRPPNARAKALRPAGRTPSKKQRIGGNPRFDPDVGTDPTTPQEKPHMRDRPQEPAGGAPPEPSGPPSTLTPRQRQRLQQLYQTGEITRR